MPHGVQSARRDQFLTILLAIREVLLGTSLGSNLAQGGKTMKTTGPTVPGSVRDATRV